MLLTYNNNNYYIYNNIINIINLKMISFKKKQNKYFIVLFHCLTETRI